MAWKFPGLTKENRKARNKGFFAQVKEAREIKRTIRARAKGKLTPRQKGQQIGRAVKKRANIHKQMDTQKRKQRRPQEDVSKYFR